jgi:hypothetical protein
MFAVNFQNRNHFPSNYVAQKLGCLALCAPANKVSYAWSILEIQ